ncbi:hypothetical protein L1987_05648 [Smallanthus sonchifolius]|uniref:Uncharacterized protein n=1 Tax=Smallanthus sonchifolius TaxID=185202 RepID=A0ACB9JW30_9ASTR|nr:hypothetical protein L1987_05648 [Smallanthus sonchifolius]
MIIGSDDKRVWGDSGELRCVAGVSGGGGGAWDWVIGAWIWVSAVSGGGGGGGDDERFVSEKFDSLLMIWLLKYRYLIVNCFVF